ncbi:MAG TPA: DMT family transporter [Propionibacteriaceae bacterium]|nr:DMT family transporter [Propionibacteriaceae bacterium]
MRALSNRGVQAALVAALLFGAGTPAAKLLLGDVSPWMLAGLLYCGSGVGLGLIRLVRRSPAVRLPRRDLPPLLGAITFGGLVGPVLLMFGLAGMPASGASLLLNAEGVFTALLAWLVFKEHFDRRIGLGMLAIVAGAVVLSVPSQANLGSPWPALAVLGACCAWGLDNNLTRKVALHDATWLACAKGLVAGPVNLLLAVALHSQFPPAGTVGSAVVVGFVAYGVSLVLFIVAMRNLGTARAGAYFTVAPFFGAVLAVALGDPVTWPMVAAGVLMAIGVWLHLSERHQHRHRHHPETHDHWHTDDEHHHHEHPDPVPAGTWHKHRHAHPSIEHSHEHFPDAHHRHGHD